MAQDAFERTQILLTQNEEQLRRAMDHPLADLHSDVILAVQKAVSEMRAAMAHASDVDVVQLHERGGAIAKALDATLRLEALLEEKRRSDDALIEAERAEKDAQSQYPDLPSRIQVGLPLWFLWYAITWIMIMRMTLVGGRVSSVAIVYLLIGWIPWLLVKTAIRRWNTSAQDAHDLENARRAAIRDEAGLRVHAVRESLTSTNEWIANLRTEVLEQLGP